MPFEEVFAQPESKDKVDVLLVCVIERIEGVVARGLSGMSWIEHAQILQAAGGLDMRQQTIQKLTLTFAIENNHRHFSTAKAAFQVLRDDVLKKRRFACAGTAHDHTVLHPH